MLFSHSLCPAYLRRQYKIVCAAYLGKPMGGTPGSLFLYSLYLIHPLFIIY